MPNFNFNYLNNKVNYNEEEPEEKEAISLESLSLNRSFDKEFLKQRKVFLWGVVDDKSAKEVINRLLYLDAQNKEEISFYINSPGGMVTSGMVIYDTMQLIESPISTICMGLAASMGSILLSAGKKGRRFVFPHGEIMIHQPSLGGVYQGTSADIEIQAEQIIKTKKIGAQILAENCNKTIDKVLKDFDRDYWMDANEAVKYGIVDSIIKKI